MVKLESHHCKSGWFRVHISLTDHCFLLLFMLNSELWMKLIYYLYSFFFWVECGVVYIALFLMQSFLVFFFSFLVMVYGSLLTKHFNVNFLYVRQTGVALGVEVDDKMPQHEYYEYFGPDYTLHVAPSNMENKNSRQLLDDIRANLLDNLSKLQHAPSVQFQERPPDTELPEVSSSLFCSMCPFLAPSFISHRTW
jgi:hypothetical protein